MALLTPRRAWCWLACAAAYGCDGSASLGHVELWLRACEGQAGCSATAPAEHFAVQGFFDPSVSRFAPHGFYAYFELPRADVRAVVELDVPTDGDAGSALEHYQVSYRELDGTRLRFDARDASGRLLLPRSFTAQTGSDCSCEDGAFALRFAEPGDDGEPGTGDDRVRELSLGQLSHADEGCARSLPKLDGEAGLRVSVSACGESAPPRAAPANSEPVAEAPSRAPSCGYGDCTSGGAVLADDGTDGCGSSTDTSSSSGCGDADDDAASDSSGCSDDDSQDSTSTHDSGCEGDTSSEEHASCAVAHRPSPRRRLGASFFGTGLPLACVWLWQALRSSRSRAAARERVSARRER